MDYKDLVENHPEITWDRPDLTFSERHPLAEIADTFSRFGLVLLKEALPPAALGMCAAAFRRFVGSSEVQDQTADGSWHNPWIVRDGDFFPAAAVLSALLKSWTWDVVEEICGSSHIVILLKWCTARHSVDQALGVGAHQDAKVVEAGVPFSIWIPLHQITPRVNSGLGFVVPAPDRILPTLPHNDVGAEYVLNDPARVWIPHYAAGDLTVHSKFSPHFTTGYGTLSDRFSLEIRAMSRSTAPERFLDPAIYVSRRNGLPKIVEARGSAAIGAQRFLESADLTAAASKELRKVFT